MRFICLLSLLMSCGTSSWSMEEADLRDGAVVVHYAIQIPPAGKPLNASGKKTGDLEPTLSLFMCMPEHVGDFKDEGLRVIETLERLGKAQQCVVVAPKSGAEDSKWNIARDGEGMSKLLTYLKKTYPINPRKVYLWARGAGAGFMGQYALEHPTDFAAVIMYSWGFDKVPKLDNPQVTLPDFYYVLGMKDLNTHVDRVRKTYGILRDAGLKVIYREVTGLGGPTKHQPTNDEAITWALQTRHKTLPLSANELAALKPYASAGEAKAAPANDDIFNLLAEVGGPQTGSILIPFFDAKSEPTQLKAIKTCTAALFGDEVCTALAKLLNNKSGRLRQAAIEALAYNANFRSAVAMLALSKLVLDAKADLEDRVKAIEGIAYALHMQTEGAFQDTKLFATMITLLNDPNVGIRAKAFDFLKPLRTSDYRPEGSDAERKAAVVDWQAWIAALEGKTGVGKHTGPIKK
jgi:hypothetical protein